MNIEERAKRLIELENSVKGKNLEDESVQKVMEEMNILMDSLSKEELFELASIIEKVFCN